MSTTDRPAPVWKLLRGFVVPASISLASSLGCQFDRADRWDDTIALPTCPAKSLRCRGALERCEVSGGVVRWVVVDDCQQRGLICAPSLLRCTACVPSERYCDGVTITACSADGMSSTPQESCEGTPTSACRDGSCVDLCAHAALVRSNVGCEYWGADLDNAMIDAARNAAAQQYAIVVSNPQPDLPVQVTIDQDDSLPGTPSQVRTVAQAEIQPLNLRVFKLGPREVDGSPEDEFNTGTGTAFTRHAYRIRTNVPVVAYQFNPLDNVAVFSNDASLLKPVEALSDNPGTMTQAYVVLGWPQTIALTDNPDTNFSTDLRAFVAIVGTRPNTHVQFIPTTRVIPGGGVAETQPHSVIQAVLQPFDVLNLESGGFNADFTGSFVDADQPVVVFSGGEASDAPLFEKLQDRACCADHLEEQIDPIRTAGYTFIAPHSPSRTRAVADAGGRIAPTDEPEFFRVVAVSDQGPTQVLTTLLPPNDSFTLPGKGAWQDITVRDGEVSAKRQDFMLWSDRPVALGNLQPSQDASFVSRGLPGGDPSLIIVPPLEQYRTKYVFLTPDKYIFDFISMAAPRDAAVLLDGHPIETYACTTAPADGLTFEERGKRETDYLVYRCQLSFPVIDPDRDSPFNVAEGRQNDGVHRLESDAPVMVLVYGFDSFVSYGYAAGTQLESISAPK